MKKKKVGFNISVDLLKRLDELPRNVIPNKSKLVEELLEKWCDKKEQTIYVEKKMSQL